MPIAPVEACHRTARITRPNAMLDASVQVIVENRLTEPPRPLEVIEADIKALEREILDLLAEVTGSRGVAG